MAFDKGSALLIGVGSYKHADYLNIPVSVRDAQAVQNVLQDANACGYLPAQVTLLHDETASRASILSALDALAEKTTPENTVAIYYCGHGAYGTDGNYYLTTHDTQISVDKVVKDTGISEVELLDRLRLITAKRVLLLFNTCHSGELSPNLGLEEIPQSFGDVSLPSAAGEAILSSGEGRIIITACRPDQKSWVGHGQLTLFTQALVEGLNGQGYVVNNHGYVSAYSLYEHVYLSVNEAAKKLGHTQEPELTVLRGVGPFPVSLYHGASHLGAFDVQEPLPQDTAAREVEPGRSQRMYQKMIHQVIASGERSVAIGRSANGATIITGDVHPKRRS